MTYYIGNVKKIWFIQQYADENGKLVVNDKKLLIALIIALSR